MENYLRNSASVDVGFIIIMIGLQKHIASLDALGGEGKAKRHSSPLVKEMMMLDLR